MEIELVGKEVVDAAVTVHRELGPGLLESVYEVVMEDVLAGRGLVVERQVPIPIVHRGRQFTEGFRADLLVESEVIVELKSVEETSRVHFKQTLTYLRLADKRLGYLINFGAILMKKGITRIVNGLQY